MHSLEVLKAILADVLIRFAFVVFSVRIEIPADARIAVNVHAIKFFTFAAVNLARAIRLGIIAIMAGLIVFALTRQLVNELTRIFTRCDYCEVLSVPVVVFAQPARIAVVINDPFDRDLLNAF